MLIRSTITTACACGSRNLAIVGDDIRCLACGKMLGFVAYLQWCRPDLVLPDFLFARQPAPAKPLRLASR